MHSPRPATIRVGSPQKKRARTASPSQADFQFDLDLDLDLDEWDVEFGSGPVSPWAGWQHTESLVEANTAPDPARFAAYTRNCDFWLRKIELASCCVAYLDKVCEDGPPHTGAPAPPPDAEEDNVFKDVHAFDARIMVWAWGNDAKASALRLQIRVEWEIAMHNADAERLHAVLLSVGEWPKDVDQDMLRTALRLDLQETHVGILKADFERMKVRVYHLLARAEAQRSARPEHVEELARINLKDECATPRTSRYETETLRPLQDVARAAAHCVEQALP